MPPHRKIEVIPETALNEEISRVPSDQYVYWTGGAYGAQHGSARSESLKTITEVCKPISVKELVSRAARLNGQRGYDPKTVRQGLRNHQGSKPAVYWFLILGSDGQYRAAIDIPFPDGRLAIRENEAVHLLKPR